ncbi:hypothetical protein B0H14DRAFT_3706485 [Mycena olivaceomarginata]|nr:hypothetical protein B0H14DRAFT_3706485 [Mycena olivaceomarginata]
MAPDGFPELHYRIPTGFVIDLSKEEYHLRDPKTNELYTIDTIIRNADNDSWETGSAMVTFAPGEAPIACRRARSLCRGCTACDQLDPALRNVVRFELDPAPRDAIIIAQQETRRREGNTPEERASIFIKIIRCAKCLAVNSNGRKCEGGPILKAKPQGTSRGHQYFVGCSGWTPKFQKGHRTHSIPDHVNENLVAKALAGLPLAGDLTKDTPLCSAIIHPHTGLKKKYCPHTHIVKGMNVRGNIQSYRCFATRSIYVPKDVSIRKALIIHNDTGHNHPMPTLTKAAFGHKDIYRVCIERKGVLGATVSKIDNAESTIQLLNGKTPGGHAPPLHNTRIKQDILHVEKLKRYPNGLGVDAILPIFETERLTKPLPERYIHSYITTQKGEIIILTFVPYLLKLLDDPGVTSFDGDTTYGGIDGKVQRVGAHHFRKSGSARLFNELQRVKLIVTGKPLALKEFVPDGNLLVTNVDMDAAQVIADVERLNAVFAADNSLPTFDPGFFDCGGSAGFGTSVPDSGSMFDNPADDFMDLYGLPTFFPTRSALPTSPPSLHLTPCRYFLPLRWIHRWALPPQRKNQPRVPRSRVGLGARLMKPTS